MKPSGRFNKLLIFNIFLSVSLISAYLFYNGFTHSLSKNGNWVSTKTQMEKGLMGAWAFYYSYRALINNRLDLGTWHGYQEVIYNKPVKPNKISFDFKLAENSYLVSYFSEYQDTMYAVRISNDSNFKSSVLKIYKGEFIEKTPLIINNLTLEWNQTIMEFKQGEFSLKVNNSNVFEQILPESCKGNIVGFRGSENSVLIDNINVIGNNSQVVFKESFERKNTQFLKLLIILILSNLLFILFQKQQNLFIAGSVNIAVLCLFLVLFFEIYGKNQYPKKWMVDWNSKKTTIENQAIINNRVSENKSIKNKNEINKILFIGTSQTWGAGASADSVTFVSRLEKMINMSGSQEVKCINAGIPEINSNELIQLYTKEWIQLKPEICIINLSNNDAGNANFKSNIEKMVKINNQQKIKTVLILEPNSQFYRKNIDNYLILTEIAKENKIQLIDMQSYLQSHKDDGFLFWDFVHLTDFGHKLFAEKLMENWNN